jgi:hypothetical protein
MKKPIFAALLAAAFALGGCATFQQKLEHFNDQVNKYAPVVGKDLLMIGNILVQAECSPALSPTSQTAVNILNVVAPNSASASKVASFLGTNQQVASQLCPLVEAIKTAVGKVPQGQPSQIIAAPVAAPSAPATK